MPVGLVKTKEDEKRWAEAKRAVRKSYPDKPEGAESFWKLTTAVYQNMRKGDKQMADEKGMKKVAFTMEDFQRLREQSMRNQDQMQAVKDVYSPEALANEDFLVRQMALGDRASKLRALAAQGKRDTDNTAVRNVVGKLPIDSVRSAPHPMELYAQRQAAELAATKAAKPAEQPSYAMRNLRNFGVGGLAGGALAYGLGGGAVGTTLGAVGGGTLGAILGKYLRDKGIAKWASMHKVAAEAVKGNDEVETSEKVSLADLYKKQEEARKTKRHPLLKKQASRRALGLL